MNFVTWYEKLDIKGMAILVILVFLFLYLFFGKSNDMNFSKNMAEKMIEDKIQTVKVEYDEKIKGFNVVISKKDAQIKSTEQKYMVLQNQIEQLKRDIVDMKPPITNVEALSRLKEMGYNVGD